MQSMQYSAPNRMYVFQICAGVTPRTPFGAVTQNRARTPPKCWLRAWM